MPPRTQFISLIEPREAWVRAFALLLRSLRLRGGSYAGATYLLLVATGAIPEGTEIYSEAGLLVKTAIPVGLFPTLNKLSLLKSAKDADHYVLLDHDIVILRLERMAPYQLDKVVACRNRKWKLRSVLGNGYGRDLSEIAGRSWERILYFNAGVVLVPAIHAINLQREWVHIAKALARRFDMPSLVGRAPFGNLSLSLALASAGIPTAALPDEFNQRNWGVLPQCPAIIHYNNFDPINHYIKDIALTSYDDFLHLLSTTDNRFWRKYRKEVTSLVDDGTRSLADRLWQAVRNSCL